MSKFGQNSVLLFNAIVVHILLFVIFRWYRVQVLCVGLGARGHGVWRQTLFSGQKQTYDLKPWHIIADRSDRSTLWSLPNLLIG